MQPRQRDRVSSVRLDALARPLWDQGGRNHHAVVTKVADLPAQPVTRRPGLEADVQSIILSSQPPTAVTACTADGVARSDERLTGSIRYHAAAGRWVLLATVLGSGLVALDATVVNIALPAIGTELDAGLASLQWTVNAYALTQAGLLLLGGSLGDRYGHRRVFALGLLWFAAASALCGAAPTAPWLIAARALQGVGAALLTPASLAIIDATFHPDDRSAAIGAWSGLGGVMTAIGPLVGGYLTGAVTWRLVFVINLPFTALAMWAALRHVPDSRDVSAPKQLDYAGAALSALGMGGVLYALTAGPAKGWASPTVLASGVGGLGALIGFVLVERASRHPLMPLEVFRSRQFTAANAVTFVVYAALGGALFLLPIQLQRVVGLSALESGLALIPMTVLMLALSPAAGRLAARAGPRLPMVLGPLVGAVGLALLARVAPGGSYVTTTFPAVIVFGLGLSITVAPLTWTVLNAAGAEHAGVASAINTVVARAAGSMAVTTVPLAAGIAGDLALEPDVFAEGFRRAMWIAAALAAAGGVLAYATIRREAVVDGPPGERQPAAQHASCPLDAPPWRAFDGRIRPGHASGQQ
jgi:EmrB/QacA subfamily drug resistance transporter